MKGLMNLIAVLCVVLCVGTAFGAAGPISPASPYVSSGTSFPDVYMWSGYMNLGLPGFTTVSAYVDFRLENHKVENADWYFYTEHDDPAIFHASLSANGMLLDGDSLVAYDNMNWQTSYQTRKGVELSESASLGFGTYYDEGDLTDEHPYVWIGGNFQLLPAEITNSTFLYREYPCWDWSPEIGFYESEKTQWYASCRFDGRFVADTLEKAQGMGAQFASVPEPSTIGLLLPVLVAVLAFLRRRCN